MLMPPSIRSGVTLAGVVAVFLFGCGDADRPRAGTGAGALDRVHVVTDAKMEVLGTSDHLSGIRDLAHAADGSIWVLNTAAPFFVVFDREGRELHQAGARGGGPFEFQTPTALVRVRQGLWAFDRARHGVTRIDPGGTGEIVTLPRDRLPQAELLSFGEAVAPGAFWVAPHDDRILFARGPDPGETDFSVGGLWHAAFVAFDPSTSVLDTVLDPRTLLASPAGHYPENPVLAPIPLWAPCPEGDLAWYDPVENRVGRVDPAAGVVPDDGTSAGDRVDLPPPRRVPTSADVLFAYYRPQILASFSVDAPPPEDELRRGFEMEFAEYRPRMADVLPEFVDFKCAPGGILWLRLLEVDTGPFARGGHWLRILLPAADEGTVAVAARVLDTLRLPDGFRPLRFSEEALWGAWFDELDVPHLARIPLAEMEER